jgi:hypothetical protein
VILAFVVLHVLTQFKSGGAAQLLRIFRPAALPRRRRGSMPPNCWACWPSSRRACRSPENVDAPPEVSSHPLQPRTEARRDRAGRSGAAPKAAHAIAKPDPAGQCVRRGGRRAITGAR